MNAAITSKAEAPDSPVSMKASVDHRVVSSQMATDGPSPSQNQSTPRPPQEKVLLRCLTASLCDKIKQILHFAVSGFEDSKLSLSPPVFNFQMQEHTSQQCPQKQKRNI